MTFADGGDSTVRVMGDREPKEEQRPSDPLRTGESERLNDLRILVGEFIAAPDFMSSGEVGAGL